MLLEFGQCLPGPPQHAPTGDGKDEQEVVRQWARHLLQHTIVPHMDLPEDEEGQHVMAAHIADVKTSSTGLATLRLAYMACVNRRLQRIASGGRRAAEPAAAAAVLASRTASPPQCHAVMQDAALFRELCTLAAQVAGAAAHPDLATQALAKHVLDASRSLQAESGGAVCPADLQHTLATFFDEIAGTAPGSSSGPPLLQQQERRRIARLVDRVALEGPLSAVVAQLEASLQQQRDFCTLAALAGELAAWPCMIALSQHAAGRMALHRCLHSLTRAAANSYRSLRLAAAAAVAVEAKGYVAAARGSPLWHRPGPATAAETDACSSSATLACLAAGCSLSERGAVTALQLSPWLDLAALHRAAWCAAAKGAPSAVPPLVAEACATVPLLPMWRALLAQPPSLSAFDALLEREAVPCFLMATLDAADCLALGADAGSDADRRTKRDALGAIFSAAKRTGAGGGAARAWLDALQAKTAGM